VLPFLCTDVNGFVLTQEAELSVLCRATRYALASRAPRLQVELMAAHAPVAHAAADDLRASHIVFRIAGRSVSGAAHVMCLSLPHQAMYRAYPTTPCQLANEDEICMS